MFHNFYQNQNDSENSKSYFCHQCQNQFNKSIPEEETPQSIECKLNGYLFLNKMFRHNL